jgi:small-conductance mechanosensitive channel
MRARTLLALLVLATLALPWTGRAEPTPAGVDAPAEVDTPTAAWIRPEEVSTRADRLLRRLEAVRIDAAAEQGLAEIERAAAELGPDLDATVTQAWATTVAGTPPEIEDVRRELTDVAAPLDGWKDALAAQARHVAGSLDVLAQAERTWMATREHPEAIAAGEVVLRRVDSSLAAVRTTAERLRVWRERVLAASDHILDRSAAVEAALEAVATELEAPRASVLIPDRTPLWHPDWSAALRRELPGAGAEILAYGRSTIEYLRRDPRHVLVQLLLAGLLMLAFRGFAAQARQRLSDGDAEAARAARLFERPYAIAILLTLLLSPILHPLAPRRLTQLLATIAVIPTARILTRTTARIAPATFVGLLVVLLLDRLTLAFAPLPAVARAILLLLVALAIALVAREARRGVALGDPPWLRRTLGGVVIALAVAFLAEIGGWNYLATLLGRGTIGSALAALYVVTAAIALEAAVAYVLRSAPLRRSHLIARRTTVLERQLQRGLRWLGIALWSYFVLAVLGLRSKAGEALHAVLAAGVSVGSLTLSLGGVLAFLLTLVVALLLARTIIGLLEEDVFPRADLPRGVPYALSTLARYGVYTLGLLFALAAAGVQLSQLSIMLGGLGIGLGLGLQDLVKNFAAGLTLLVERRVHVGDAIQTSSQDVLGRVLAIGMRATTVRNWNGAEVVVPNADLVSTAVTNWTLSDRLCRLEIPVGVAYGSDPKQVLALLLDAVRAVDALLAEPAPQALFKGFGDSSLDFVVRAWTDQGYEGMLPLTSALVLAVHGKLRDAGITIPFPQRDLHLASVTPEARAALAGAGAKKGETP